jgi:hypothetical protein
MISTHSARTSLVYNTSHSMDAKSPTKPTNAVTGIFLTEAEY